MDLTTASLPTPLQRILDETTEGAGISLYLKRDDLIHPVISGNKWRKLCFILNDIQRVNADSVLTFGGARSNHLYATAAAGETLGLKAIGIVRGEEYQYKDTQTLKFCREKGMRIYAISRTEYRQKYEAKFLAELKLKFGNPYVIPEGASSPLALPGVRELVYESEAQLGSRPNFFAVAVGTGGTAAGILSAKVRVLGFSSLKGGHFLEAEIGTLVNDPILHESLTLFNDYHFGGYARHSPKLLQFMSDFEIRHQVPLEHVYTGKMLYGLYDLIKNNYFQKGTVIVAVHTGGLQGRLSG